MPPLVYLTLLISTVAIIAIIVAILLWCRKAPHFEDLTEDEKLVAQNFGTRYLRRNKPWDRL